MTNADNLNWTLFIADNLDILRGIDSESIDLIATDPPFNKGVKAFEGIVAAGKDRKGKPVSYKDVWTWRDVQNEWTESIRNDHPNLYAVIRGANAGGGYGGVHLLTYRPRAGDAVVNNNHIKRLNGTVKERDKVFRGFKRVSSAQQYINGWFGNCSELMRNEQIAGFGERVDVLRSPSAQEGRR